MNIVSIAESSSYLSQINIRSTKARLLQQSKPPQLTVTRERGGFEMESHPIQLDIDNRAFFDSIGLKSINALAKENVAKGQKAVLDSMADYAKEADTMAIPHNNDAISDIAVMRTTKNIETMLNFIPEEPPQLNWTGGYVDISYMPDNLDFNWDVGGIKRTYIPFAVELEVEE